MLTDTQRAALTARLRRGRPEWVVSISRQLAALLRDKHGFNDADLDAGDLETLPQLSGGRPC